MSRKKTDFSLIIMVSLALGLGVLFGNLIGNLIIKEDLMDVSARGDDRIYLLQVGALPNETTAQNKLKELKQLGHNGIIVKDGNMYFVYLDIALSNKAFNDLANTLDSKGIDYLIVERYLSLIIDKEKLMKDYDFYHETVKYYTKLLNKEKVVFSDTYLDMVTDDRITVFTYLNSLNNYLHNQISLNYELLVYKTLIETLT